MTFVEEVVEANKGKKDYYERSHEKEAIEYSQMAMDIVVEVAVRLNLDRDIGNEKNKIQRYCICVDPPWHKK